MLPKSQNECDAHAPDPIASGALPWLLDEFARIQDRYFAGSDQSQRSEPAHADSPSTSYNQNRDSSWY
jgi:hypothetical protein